MQLSTISYAARVFNRYLFYLKTQKWDRNKIDGYQDRQLVKVVQHAAEHVPYYRNLFKEIGFDPSKFKGRTDMYKIPLLDKETLRTRQMEFVADNADQYGIHWDSTSGSTGTPLRFIIDDETKAHKLAAVIRSYCLAGYFPGKKTFSIQSYQFEKQNDISKRYKFINMWRFNSRLLKKETGIEVLNLINRFKPKVFIGYPFSILMLSKFAKDEGISIQPLQAIVTAGETLSENRRRLLENAFKCKVYDFYSHHEDVAIISECKHQKRHVFEDFAYNEIVNETGSNLPWEGSTGEIVGTGFYNYAMPLIRYKLGDTVKTDNSGHRCRCGSSFKTVKQIIGRQNDYIETPDGHFIGNVLEHAVDHAKGVILSQCVQDAIDHIYVNLIVDDTYTEESAAAFRLGLLQRLGNKIDIEFKIVKELEKNKSGKTPFIMSKIEHEYI